jgi:ABC-2 type transport system ATP-binding protein
MLQRIGLAQAMLNNPDIVFLDEPTSGLDPLGRRLVRDIIRQLKDNGTTVFLNSHLLSEVEATCDRVAFIKEGRIVQMDDVSNLLNLTTEVYLRVDAIKPELLSDLERFGKSLEVNHGAISLMVDKMEVVPSIAQLVVQHGARLYELKPRQRSLEEVFLKAVGSTEQDSQ